MPVLEARRSLPYLAAILCLAAVGPVVGGGEPPARDGGRKTDRLGDDLPEGAVGRLGTLRLRHRGYVMSVAFSPDGKKLVSCGDDGIIATWDATSGKAVEFLKQSSAVSAASYSADGRHLAAVRGKDVSLYEMPEGYERVIRGDVLEPTAVALSPDGKRLATGDARGALRLWDVATREEVRKWRFRDATSMRAVAFSPDGKLLACARGNGQGNLPGEAPVHLLDVETGKEVRAFSGHRECVHALAFSPDGKTLASSGGDIFHKDLLSVRLWDVATGEQVWVEKEHAGMIAFSPDGKTLAEGFGGAVRFLRASDGHVLLAVDAHRSPISAVSFSPDGTRLATSSHDNTIRLWNVADGKELTPVQAMGEGVYSVAFSPDGKVLATRSGDNLIRLWDVGSTKQLKSLSLSETMESSGDGPFHYRTRTVSFSPDGRFVAATGPVNKTMYVWEVQTGKTSRVIQIRDLVIYSLVGRADGTLIAASREKDGVTVWSPTDGRKVLTLDLPQGRYVCAAASPGRRIIAAATDSGQLYWCDGRTGKLLPASDAGVKVECLALSPDGKMMATVGGGDRQAAAGGGWEGPVVGLWDVATGMLVRQFKGHRGSVHGVDFSPDGLTIASAGADDRTVRLWSALTGQALGKREGHTGAVYGVAFAPDGKTVASGSADGTVLLWDTRDLAPAPAAKDLSPEQLRAHWSDLTNGDVGRVYAALAALVAGRDVSVKFLAERVKPAREPDAKRARELIAALDANEFETREKARGELADYEAAAEPALSKALEGSPSAEQKASLEALLARLRDPRPAGEQLRATRAVQVLEYVGSPAAAEVLESLAKGSAGANLTRDAKSAAERLKLRRRG
jgi:WD40 repeat protein